MSRSKKPGWPVKTAVSAGGIVYKIEKGQVFLVLISPRQGIWSLPKGLAEKESLEETALREVKEEAGVEGEIVAKIGQIDYWFAVKEERVRIRKRVHYFLMKYVLGDPKNHDWEVEDARWFPIREAEHLLSYSTDKEIVRKAIEFLKKQHPGLL